MKKHLKIIPFIIAVSILLSFSVNALDKSKVITDAPRNEHVFTKAELACMSDSVFGLSSENNEEFVEIKNIEGKTTRASTTYYIIEMNDGYMLTSPSSGTFSRTRYANSGSNDVRKWIFTEDNDGNYIVYSNTDKAKCLTVNPSTGNVSLSNYTGSKYQKWKMYYSGNGNALSSMATDSPVYGYKLVINSTSCSVSNTTFTPVGFFDVSWYVPVSTLSYPNFYLALDQKKTVTPNKTPENAITSNNWIKWSTTFPRITIDGKGRVTGMVEGVTGLTFTDKITRKTGSCIVNVTCLPNGTYFLKNKETSEYAKVKNATMADNQNVVQYDFEGSASQRWIFTLNSSTGYYSIRSANSAYHYMAVRNDSTFNDMPIVIMGATESTLTDGMKWTVSKLPDGAYKITPKTGESNGYVLATSTSLETNNAGLVQGDYINNNSYRDEWILISQSDYVLMYLGYEDGDPEMPPIVDDVSDELEAEAGMKGYGYTALTEKEMLAHLSSTTVFSCITHGLQNELGTTDGSVTISDINSLDSTAFDNLKFVYFGACLTGKGGSGANNLVNAVYNKGADAVLGFTISVFVDETNLWTKEFMLALANGATLSSAMNTADYAVANDPELDVLPYYSTSSTYRYLQGSNQMIPCS